LALPAWAGLYVTDQLEITLRSGPGLDYKILKMLPSGMELTQLEEREGWTRVRTPPGDEGWVVSRYLTAEAPKGPRLEAATRDLEKLRTDSAAQKKDLEALRGERDRLAADSRRLEGRLAAVEKEYAEWKKVNEGVVALRDKAQTLEAEQQNVGQELERLRSENQSLKTRETFYWFFSGVIVLLLGWVLGYVYASSRQRAKAQSRFRF
jgi:SH3 domain protein